MPRPILLVLTAAAAGPRPQVCTCRRIHSGCFVLSQLVSGKCAPHSFKPHSHDDLQFLRPSQDLELVTTERISRCNRRKLRLRTKKFLELASSLGTDPCLGLLLHCLGNKYVLSGLSLSWPAWPLAVPINFSRGLRNKSNSPGPNPTDAGQPSKSGQQRWERNRQTCQFSSTFIITTPIYVVVTHQPCQIMWTLL